MKIRVLIPILIIGAATGYGGAAIMNRPPDRATRIADLFQDICLPSIRPSAERIPERFDLVAIKTMSPEIQAWVDPLSKSFVKFNGRKCWIATSHPNALSEADALHLADRITTIVETTFPDLPFDPKSQMGKISVAWMDGPVQSQKRWGVYLFAFPDWGDGAGSTLNYMAPLLPEA